MKTCLLGEETEYPTSSSVQHSYLFSYAQTSKETQHTAIQYTSHSSLPQPSFVPGLNDYQNDIKPTLMLLTV